jgi:hypothetical protein
MSSKKIKFWILFSLIALNSLVILTMLTNFAKESFYKLFFEKIVYNTIIQSGTCPAQVEVWSSMRAFEGGAEHTAIAHTLAIANDAKLISSNKEFVEYEATLKPLYVSCIGTTHSPAEPRMPSVYQFQFHGGKVYFRLALPTITYHGIDAYQPYVRWTAWDGC